MTTRFPGYESRSSPGGQFTTIGPSAAIGGSGVDFSPASRALTKIGQQEQRMEVAEQSAKRRIGGLQARKELLTHEAALEENQDFEAHGQLHEQHADALRQSAAQYFGEDQAGYEQWKAEFDLNYENSAVRVRGRALRKRNDRYKAELDVSLEEYANAAVSSVDDLDVAQNTDGAMLAILEAREQGAISDLDAVRKSRRFRSDVAEGRVREAIRVNPGQALAALEAGEFQDIQGKDRTLIMELAQSRVDAAEARARSAAGVALSSQRGLIKDHMTSLQMTGEGIPGLQAEMKTLLSADQYAAFVEQEAKAQTLYSMHEGFRTQTPAEMSAATAALAPVPGAEGFAADAELYARAEKMRVEELQRRADDPALAAMRVEAVGSRFEGVEPGTLDYGRALDTRMEAQASVGVPANQIRLLTTGEAKSNVAEINSASAAMRAGVILEMQRRYGQHAAMAFQEMRDQGLNAGHQVLAVTAGDPTRSEIAATALGMETSELRKDIPSGEITDMNAAIINEMSDFTTAVLAGGQTADRIGEIRAMNEAVQKIGMFLLKTPGTTGGDAAETAAKFITDNYHVEDTWYSPTYIDGQPIDPGRVEDAAADRQTVEMLEAFDPVPFGSADPDRSPEELKAELIKVASRDGYWITAPDGESLYLKVPLVGGGDQLLRNASGQYYSYKIRDLSVAGGADKPEPVEMRFRGDFR